MDKRSRKKRTRCIINIDKYQPVRKFAMWPYEFACTSVAHFSSMHAEQATRSLVTPFLFARTFHVVSVCIEWLDVIFDFVTRGRYPRIETHVSKAEVKSFLLFSFLKIFEKKINVLIYLLYCGCITQINIKL